MRIRGRKPAADCSVSLSASASASASASSSSLSDSSSITGAHSLASSQDSSNSCPFSLYASASHRCRGLDLLVKAIHQVTAGSVVGVPYIQRRVMIRRRRRQRCLEFDHFLSDELPRRKREKNAEKLNKIDTNNNKKMKKTKGKDLMGLPPRIQDSVLHPWGRRSDLVGEMGL